MTIFDLLFLVAFLSALATLVRVLYLSLRKRSTPAKKLLTRLAFSIAAYFAVLISTSLFQTQREIPEGTPQCSDDWCLVVDGATRQPTIGASTAGDFVIVKATVLSRARARPQRETDVRGELLDDRGRRYAESDRGRAALRAAGGSDATLTDFVAASGSNRVQLVFEVSPDAKSCAFVTRHGWFPRALVIADPESFFHHPARVPLPDASRT